MNKWRLRLRIWWNAKAIRHKIIKNGAKIQQQISWDLIVYGETHWEYDLTTKEVKRIDPTIVYLDYSELLGEETDENAKGKGQ